eukprot:3028499-Rhodomonas_salina.1
MNVRQEFAVLIRQRVGSVLGAGVRKTGASQPPRLSSTQHASESAIAHSSDGPAREALKSRSERDEDGVAEEAAGDLQWRPTRATFATLFLRGPIQGRSQRRPASGLPLPPS